VAIKKPDFFNKGLQHESGFFIATPRTSVWGPVVTSYENSNEILISTKGNKLFSVSE
jgi:hypothetical protein